MTSEGDLVHGCPSEEDLTAVLDSADNFTLVIRGFSCVEAVIDTLLTDALSQVDALDVQRLTVGLKLNLAKALGLLDQSDVPLIAGFSRIRNNFAHDFKATITANQMRDLVNSLSPRQRQMYDAIKHTETEEFDRQTLWRAILLLWRALTWAVAYHRDERDHREATLETLHNMAECIRRGEPPVGGSQDEIDRIVEEKRRRRAASYSQGPEKQ